jgi:RHS repeat-associated protein
LQFDKDVTGEATLSASDLSHRYLWQANAVDQLMADEHVNSGTVVLPLADQQGTIRDLAITNNGITSVANHRVYDSFGNLESQTNAAVDCLFGYTGRAYDNNTGLQNNTNRWYDAKVGGWISKDPKGFAAGQTNLYVYCGNSPTNATDPTGLDAPGSPYWQEGYAKWRQEVARKLREDSDKKFAANLANLKTALLACSSSLTGTKKAECDKEIDGIIAGLQAAYTNLWNLGGPSRFSYFGPVCTDCQNEVLKRVPNGTPGSYFDVNAVFHMGVKVPFIDYSFPDHAWCEIIFKPTGKVFTIDFWAGGTDFWRAGADSFGYKHSPIPPPR